MKYRLNTHAGQRSAPRNPLVVPARFRLAGAHRERNARQQQALALRRELNRLTEPDR